MIRAQDSAAAWSSAPCDARRVPPISCGAQRTGFANRWFRRTTAHRRLGRERHPVERARPRQGTARRAGGIRERWTRRFGRFCLAQPDGLLCGRAAPCMPFAGGHLLQLLEPGTRGHVFGRRNQPAASAGRPRPRPAQPPSRRPARPTRRRPRRSSRAPGPASVRAPGLFVLRLSRPREPATANRRVLRRAACVQRGASRPASRASRSGAASPQQRRGASPGPRWRPGDQRGRALGIGLGRAAARATGFCHRGGWQPSTPP